MHHCAPHRCSRLLFVASVCAALGVSLMLAGGCSRKVKNKAPVSRYTALPEKKVPEFLKDTIFERTELANADSYLVSGFGLVANLDGTGNSDAPNAVRDYMIKQMLQHRFGSSQQPGFEDIPPERVLRDPRFALVRVDGYLPPGVREGDYFDINVSALNQSTTTSLARGDLYQTDLRTNGASMTNPGGAVNVWARAQGPVFVNPAYALGQAPDQASAKQSLRRGIVMDGGRAMTSRPLALRLLQPQRSMARRIEMRIDEYFQEVKPDTIAAAQDEGIVYLYVPYKFRGDWQHFAAVVSHLYLRGSEAFSATKAKQLAEEAVKPGAPLGDITYCWEGLGPFGLPYYRDLMSHQDSAVAFAAARAAAFLGDPIAPQALARIAKIKGDQWQLDAIRTLGALPNSPSINELLRPLLNSDQTLVRTETYKVLAAQNDPATGIFSTVIKPQNQPVNEKFVLDVVRSAGPPIIHATRTGIPRIAIIGDRAQLNLPVTFSAMGGRLTISSAPNAANVTIFYRAMASPDGGRVPPPIKVVSRPDLAEIVARLGGEGGSGLNFNYGDVVSILNALTDAKKLSAMANGQRVPASFVLQELPFVEDAIFNAPALPDARPQSDEPGKVGMAK